MAKKKSDSETQVKRPKNPMPAQHQNRPGIEAKMTPQPEFLAPNYKGAEKLKDKVALITGGDSGIGRSVAVLFAREGADVAIVFLPQEKVDAEETARVIKNEGRDCLLIPGDVSKIKVLSNGNRKDGPTIRQAGHSGQQRRLSTSSGIARRHFRRTVGKNF
jgi:hypothetical protein